MNKTREEHLEWCKQRAREYLDRGDQTNAVASFMSDMEKHDETKNHGALPLMLPMLMMGSDMKRFIEGFN